MINRREFIQASSLFAAGSFTKDLFAASKTINFGWMPDFGTRKIVKFSTVGQHLRGTGKDKVVRLWKVLERAQAQAYENYIQTEGTCVSQASALGATTLDAIQQVMHRRGKWVGHYAAEPIYAGSKIEIGIDQGRVAPSGAWRWRAFQGTTCEYAVQWMLDYGLVPRGKYGDIDLSKTDCNLAVRWATSKNGVPAEIETEAKKNPLLSAVKIDGGWEQACDAIASGYPVVVGSSQGFGSKTNSNGLLSAQGVWYHAMLLWGIDTKSTTHAGCFAQSWPKEWVSGPEYKYGTPVSGFWTEARNINEMLQEGSSYALSDLHGYPLRVIDYSF